MGSSISSSIGKTLNEIQKENISSYVCAANRNKNEPECENNVCFYYNKDFTFKVNREKLIDNSAYFREIVKDCYKDNKTEFTEFVIPEEFHIKSQDKMKRYVNEVFRTVMEFINTGTVTLDIKTLLETYHVADYFQLDRLQRLCLDHFTHNLKRKTLESPLQLDTIAYSSSLWMHSCLNGEFEERALMFKRSGRPSFSGLYFLQDNIQDYVHERRSAGTYLRMFDKKLANVCQLDKLKEVTFYSLYYFNHVLCSVVRDGTKVLLFQYHLVSGNMSMSMVGIENRYFACDKYTVCSNSDKLFVIGKTMDKNDACLLSLSVYERKNFTDSLSLSAVKKLNVFLCREYKNSRLWLSHCYDEKIYVFYSCYNRRHTASDYNRCSFNEIYLLIICSKSFQILKNEKLSARIRFYENVYLKNFEKMFFCQKKEKLYIKVPKSSLRIGRCNPYEKVLVFDMKYNFFYFVENFLPSSLPFGGYLEFKFTLGRDGTVYGVRQYSDSPDPQTNSRNRWRFSRKSRTSRRSRNEYWTEFRAFNLKNDKLVDQGEKFKIPASSTAPEVTHACFV